MVGRTMFVFLVICLLAIYGMNSFVTTTHLDATTVNDLKIITPNDNNLALESSNPEDQTTIKNIAAWYNSVELQGVGLSQNFQGLTQLNWELKDGRHLLMYAPKEYQGYIFVKDYKMPLIYKFKAPEPQDLKPYQVFTAAAQN